MRTRRSDQLDLTQADQLIAGNQPSPRHRGLSDLLDAARAPGTPEELAGEQAAVAAFAAVHKRAAAPRGKDRARAPSSARTVVVTAATSLALLALTGTAVTARAGNLPDEAQQHAHRLFSALGVPAPRTGPTNPVITTSPSADRTKPGSKPSATPTPAPDKSAGAPTPSPGATATAVPAGWCKAWQAKPSGKALNSESRRRLVEAAGGEDQVDDYCADLTASPTPENSATTLPAPSTSGSSSPSNSPSPSASSSTKPRGKPSNLPTPHATTPSRRAP
ncbi:hypothetical protein ACWKSP_22840 [Micromonosporaceae bacterium Da 78-11]